MRTNIDASQPKRRRKKNGLFLDTGKYKYNTDSYEGGTERRGYEEKSIEFVLLLKNIVHIIQGHFSLRQICFQKNS